MESGTEKLESSSFILGKAVVMAAATQKVLK
jgi:hypothetical protein